MVKGGRKGLYSVTCDATAIAIGGVISQRDDEQKHRPVSFCSRALNTAERNHSALDRDCKYIPGRCNTVADALSFSVACVNAVMLTHCPFLLPALML